MTASGGPGLRVHWDAVVPGAGLALAIAVPAIVAAEVVDALADLGPESNVMFVFYVAVVASLVVGGWRAAKWVPEAPLTHGALAALVAYAVVAVATTAFRLARGDDTDVVGLVFNALMAVTAGIVGGLVAGRRAATAGSEPGDAG